MTDVHSKAQRSFNMSKIKGHGTKPEIVIAGLLKALKIPFKANFTELPGKPDIYISALNLVINIHGCFWHGHKNCRYFVLPKSNPDFWIPKINSNIKRDRKVNRLLKKEGYAVLTIWECEVKDGSYFEKILHHL